MVGKTSRGTRSRDRELHGAGGGGRGEGGGGERLLFTAVRKACHNGIAGFLLKVRQYERDLWKKLSTKPSMVPHPLLSRLREDGFT